MERTCFRKIATYIKVSLPWYIGIPIIFFSVIAPILLGCNTYQEIGSMLGKAFSFLSVITFSNIWHIELQQKTDEVYNLLPRMSIIRDILRRIAVRFIFLSCMVGICFIGYCIKGLHVHADQEASAMCIQAFLFIEAIIILFGSISFYCVNLSGNLAVGVGVDIILWMVMVSVVAYKLPTWINFFSYGVSDDWFKSSLIALIVGIGLFIAGTVVIDKKTVRG